MTNRSKPLLIALGCVILATLLSYTDWKTRWILLSYIPIALFIIHVGLLLLVLSNPKYWSLFKAYFIVPVAVYMSLGLWVLTALGKDSSGWSGMLIPYIVVTFPALPFQLPEIVEKRIDRKEQFQRRVAIESGTLSIEQLLKEKGERSQGELSGIYSRLSAGGNFSTDVLRSLILDYEWRGHPPDTEIIRLALSHPNTDSETLSEFYQRHPDSNHSRSLALNPNTPLEIVERMAQSSNDYVRIAAVQTGRLSLDLIEQVLLLSLDSASLQVKGFVAESQYATVDMLRRLMNSDRHILEAVASNPNATEEMLRALAVHAAPRVRAAVIVNPRTSEEIVSLALTKLVDRSIEDALTQRNRQGIIDSDRDPQNHK